MLTKKEENRLWTNYGKDCDALWIEHNRSVKTPPSEKYLKAKEVLREELEEDLEALRGK